MSDSFKGEAQLKAFGQRHLMKPVFAGVAAYALDLTLFGNSNKSNFDHIIIALATTAGTFAGSYIEEYIPASQLNLGMSSTISEKTIETRLIEVSSVIIGSSIADYALFGNRAVNSNLLVKAGQIALADVLAELVVDMIENKPFTPLSS
jgi:hypothetical protein